ncbi:DUF3019 domain-containing protein [Bowmanella yangjiangensis]|uniref:DUF3019 domain-containing protein n=1 Tax=Bowmanella yangjiangensis TaxID=2811230 RepID=A0ABS3CWI1_9ALTE|nr:DUF3019 domain-containing protein [Bowmanella yangjiangensis]MBN7821482.1 DUF3019 domain-containing protein [Bowmanella yangjiangensis]
MKLPMVGAFGLLAFFAFPFTYAAEDLGWRIKPNVCVVKEMGDACQLQLSIEILGDLPPDACLFFSNQELQCWQVPTKHVQLSLSYSETATLSMRHDDQDILTETLEVKAQSAFRQRVRKPWSLF